MPNGIDTLANVPASVVVSFPRTNDGVRAATFAVTVNLIDLELDDYGDDAGHVGEYLIHSSAIGNFLADTFIAITDNTRTPPISSPDDWLERVGVTAAYNGGTTYSLGRTITSGGDTYIFINDVASSGHAAPDAIYWLLLPDDINDRGVWGTGPYVVGDEVSCPVNTAEILALAQQIATDFYLWRLASLEVRYVSIAPWIADGMHDVEWQHGASISTHVHRSEWSPDFGEQKQASVYRSSDNEPTGFTGCLNRVNNCTSDEEYERYENGTLISVTDVPCDDCQGSGAPDPDPDYVPVECDDVWTLVPKTLCVRPLVVGTPPWSGLQLECEDVYIEPIVITYIGFINTGFGWAHRWYGKNSTNDGYPGAGKYCLSEITFDIMDPVPFSGEICFHLGFRAGQVFVTNRDGYQNSQPASQQCIIPINPPLASLGPDTNLIATSHAGDIISGDPLVQYAITPGPCTACDTYPIIDENTADIDQDAATISGTGTDLSTTPGDNLFTFNLGAAGICTVCDGTNWEVMFTTNPLSAGVLTATVLTDGCSSGVEVEVGNVVVPSGIHIVWVGKEKSDPGGTASFSRSITVETGMLFVCVSVFGSTGIPSFLYDGGALNADGNPTSFDLATDLRSLPVSAVTKTLAINFSGQQKWSLQYGYVTGLVNNVKDKTAFGTGTGSTQPACGPTAATTVADEILIGCFTMEVASGSTWTWGDGFTSGGEDESFSSGFGDLYASTSGFRIVSATAAYSSSLAVVPGAPFGYTGTLITYS